MKILPFVISEVPRIGGVYLLFDEEKELIYVGISQDIRQRLQQHTSKNSKRPNEENGDRYTTKIPYEAVKYYAYIPYEDERERKCVEANLIYCFNPKYNSDDVWG